MFLKSLSNLKTCICKPINLETSKSRKWSKELKDLYLDKVHKSFVAEDGNIYRVVGTSKAKIGAGRLAEESLCFAFIRASEFEYDAMASVEDYEYGDCAEMVDPECDWVKWLEN